MSEHDRGTPHRAVIQEILIEKMRSDLSRRNWWQTARGRFVIATGVLSVAGTGVAGLVLLESRPVSETTVVHCLEGPYRNGDGTLSGAAVSVAAPDGVISIADAEATCEQMWLSGAFEQSDPLNPTPSPGSVPGEFRTCVTSDGEAAVVPGRLDCSELKLHPYQPNVSTGR